MKKFEYRTKIIDAKGMWGGKVNLSEFDKTINEMGNDGWEMVTTTASNEAYGSTRYIICIFKREIE